jgi:hypothetical protein
LGTVQEQATEYFKVLEAVLGVKASVSSDEVNCIRIWLDKKRLNSNIFDRYVGERLDLHLFCIRFLLVSEQQNNDNFLRKDIERYLDPILLQHLALENTMRPFLLPFYDLAIRSLKDDLVQTVLLIRMARCQRYSGTLTRANLVFYFPLNSENGIAVFLPPDMQGGQRFDLGVSRQQVITAASYNQTVPLPEELVSLIEQSWSQSIPVDVSWDDSVCWTPSQSQNRLTLNQWPFDSRLAPNRLWGIIR